MPRARRGRRRQCGPSRTTPPDARAAGRTPFRQRHGLPPLPGSGPDVRVTAPADAGLPHGPDQPGSPPLEMDSIVLRPLRAGERSAVLEVFAGLSERSRRLRFLGSKPRLLESDLAHLSTSAAAVTRPSSRSTRSRASRSESRASCATRTRPRRRSRSRSSTAGTASGSGGSSSGSCGALALAQGILRFRAVIAHGNLPAFALVRGLGEELTRRYEDGNVELVVRLA